MHFITVDNKNKLDPKKVGVMNFPAAVSLGEEIPASRNGRVRINSNSAVARCKDKARLLYELEKANIPVPTPFHNFRDFHDGRAFDYGKFDNTFTYPLMIRDNTSSSLISDRTELLGFLKKRQSLSFVIYSIRMEEFHTARFTICPLLKKQTLHLEKGKKIEMGVIKVDLSGPTPKFLGAMIEESHKAALTLDVDLGTVEMLYDEEGQFVIHNVSLDADDPEQYIRQVIAAKALKR